MRTRRVLAYAGVALIAVGAILGLYGSINGNYSTSRVPEIFRGVVVWRPVTVWTPSPIFWVGIVTSGAGVVALAIAEFVIQEMPEVRRRIIEPIPA